MGGQDSVGQFQPPLLQLISQQCHLGDVQPQLLKPLHLGKYLPRSALHGDLPLIHDIYMVRVNNFFHIMCDQDHCDLIRAVQFPDGVYHFLAAAGIQHGGRFVQYDTLRMHGQHPGDGHPLFLTAGELVGGVGAVLIHAHRLQALFHPFPYLLCGNAQILRAKSHVLLHDLSDDLVVRVLEHHSRSLAYLPHPLLLPCVYTVHPHRALGGLQYGVQMFGQRGLSRAVVPYDSYEIPPVNPERYIVYRFHGAFHIAVLIPPQIFICQIFGLYNAHSYIPQLTILLNWAGFYNH